MGHQPCPRPRALRLRSAEAEKLIMMFWLAWPALIVNTACAALALLAKDPTTFLVAWGGASFAFYGLLFYAEYGRSPMGYRSLAMQLRWDMTNNKYRPGQRIPSIANLAREFNTTRTTVMRAVHLLIEEGLVETVRGRGTYVLGGKDGPAPRFDHATDRIRWHLVEVASKTSRGGVLPSAATLAEVYDTSPSTVRRVQADLAKEGVIRRNIRGAYVRA